MSVARRAPMPRRPPRERRSEQEKPKDHFEVLPAYDYRQAHEELVRQVVELYRDSQLRRKAIAAELRISETLVIRILEEAGVRRREPLVPRRTAGGAVERWHNDPVRLERIANFTWLAAWRLPLDTTDVDDLRERIGLFLVAMALGGHRIRFRR